MKSRSLIKRVRVPRLLRATAVMLTFVIVVAASASGSSATNTRRINIAALGDSISAAWGANGNQVREEAESWSDGTDALVDSHRSRLAALFGVSSDTTVVNPINNASSGSSVASPTCGLMKQIDGTDGLSSCGDGNGGSAHEIVPLGNDLDYVTFEGGTADVCGADMLGTGDPTSVADFQAAIHAGFNELTGKMAPGGVLLVASIPDWYQLAQEWPTGTDDILTRPDFACPLLFEKNLGPDHNFTASPATQVVVRDRVNAYNAVLQTECAALPFCRYDGGAVHALHFTFNDLSSVDHFHFSPSGQA
jgi:hypothetical protein